MTTPPDNDACNDSAGRDDAAEDSASAPRRVDDATPAIAHRRPHRALHQRIPLRSYVLNAVAIVIAVLVAPALTRSSPTMAVPRTQPVATAAGTVTSPAATDHERFSSDVPSPGLDRDATRDDLDHDDTDAPPPPATLVATNGSDFVAPVPGAITGEFGQRFHPILHYWRMHNGVDMHAGCGTVVIASYRGKVVEAGRNGGYGNLVVIDHGNYKGKHVISKYAHLSRIGVRVGDRVDTGQGIALSGTTGLSTGCHLHFEIKENGVYVDPAPYLTGKPSPRPDGPIADLGPTTSPSPKPSASPKPSTAPTKSPKPSPSTKSPQPSPSTKTPEPGPSPSATTSPSPSPTPTPSSTREPESEPKPSVRATSAPSRPTPTPETSEPKPKPSSSPTGRTPAANPSPSESATP